MALPKNMRLKGHRTFNYIHKNSTKYYGEFMTFKVASSNPDILLSHKLSNKSNNLRVAISISKKFSKKAVERNKIYFFLRPSDRNSELLKINLAIPETFKTNLKKEKISLCKVKIGGFESRTKCLEDIPADIEITTDESSLRSLNIYPHSPIPYNKDSIAIVLKVFNPNKSGLFQFHSYGQPKGQSVLSYLGSWTILLDD